MHGNTETTGSGLQDTTLQQYPWGTRNCLSGSSRIYGAHLGGVHIELTGENVTECLGRRERHHRSGPERVPIARQLDPRLNYEQALELALMIATNARSG